MMERGDRCVAALAPTSQHLLDPTQADMEQLGLFSLGALTRQPSLDQFAAQIVGVLHTTLHLLAAYSTLTLN